MAEERFSVYRPGDQYPIWYVLDRQTQQRSRVFTDRQEAQEACDRINRLYRAQMEEGRDDG